MDNRYKALPSDGEEPTTASVRPTAPLPPYVSSSLSSIASPSPLPTHASLSSSSAFSPSPISPSDDSSDDDELEAFADSHEQSTRLLNGTASETDPLPFEVVFNGEEGFEDHDHILNYMKDLRTRAPLPQKLKRSHAPVIAASLTVAGASCALYAQGAINLNKDEVSIPHVIGGLGSNGPPSMYFTFEVASMLGSFKKFPVTAAAASTVGFIATLPATFASSKLAGSSAWGYAQTCMTLVGNIPLNVFGIFDTLLRFSKKDDPKLRTFLINDFFSHLPEKYQNIRDQNHGRAFRYIGTGVGTVVGLSIGASLAGYACNTEVTMEKYTDSLYAWIISAVANAPAFLLGLCVSGVDLTKNVLGTATDLYAHVTGTRKLVITPGDRAANAVFALCVVVAAGFARFSSATSEVLYRDCPEDDFDPTLYAALREDVIQGSEFFNFYFLSTTLKALINYIKVAYAKESHDVYMIRSIYAYLKNASVEELQVLAKTHFASREAEWSSVPFQPTQVETAIVERQPDAAPQPSNFGKVVNFFNFCRNKPAAPLVSAEANQALLAEEGASRSAGAGSRRGS